MTECLDEIKRARLCEWFKSVVFPQCFSDGGDYFAKIFEHSDKNCEWTIEDPGRSIFQFTADPKSLTRDGRGITGGELVPVAVVQRPVYFWDAIFSAFILFAPKVFRSPVAVALSVLEHIKRLGYAREQFLNFYPEQEAWLIGLVDGSVPGLTFLKNPFETTIAMEALLWFNTVGGFSQREEEGYDDEEKLKIRGRNEKNKEFLTLLVEERAGQWEKIVGPFEK